MLKVWLQFLFWFVACCMRNRLFLEKLESTLSEPKVILSVLWLNLESTFREFFCTQDFIRLCLVSHPRWEQKSLMLFSLFFFCDSFVFRFWSLLFEWWDLDVKFYRSMQKIIINSKEKKPPRGTKHVDVLRGKRTNFLSLCKCAHCCDFFWLSGSEFA